MSNAAPKSAFDAGDDAHAEMIRQAIESANLNVLRLALLQVTGDPQLAAMKVVKEPQRGGALLADVLAPEDREPFKRRAFELLSDRPLVAGPLPDKGATRRLMEIFTGEPVSDNEFGFGYEELALDDFPRDVRWTDKPAAETLAKFHVVIVGAGVSGISTAVQLGRLGIGYTIIEKQASAGGTWVRNTYPGARIDTTTALYQFKFEKNYPWTEYFPTQEETRKYLVHLTKKFDIEPHIRFGTELVSATWDEDAAQWALELRGADGATQRMRTSAIVSASGLFATPNLPDIPDIALYTGKIFHTTAWDHDYDFAGKDVALIGNGSTGTQLMPLVAAKARSLTAFQRTPQWIMGLENYRERVSPAVRWLFDNVPFYWNWNCYAAFLTSNKLQGLQEHDEAWKQQGGVVNERNDKMRASLIGYIKDKLGDREDLIAKSIPDYAPLARRLVVDNGWYEALRRDNVELVTDRIERFTKTGIIDKTGRERHFDMVVLGSGFATSKYFWPVVYSGRDGRTMDQVWEKDGPRAHLGMTVPGFPNFFAMYGPSAQARAGGFYSWAESWTRYIVTAMVRMLEAGATSIEPRQDAYEAYNARMDAQNSKIVWETDGKGGYYVTKDGRSYVNQPWRTHDYHAMIVEPRMEDFILR